MAISSIHINPNHRIIGFGHHALNFKSSQKISLRQGQLIINNRKIIINSNDSLKSIVNKLNKAKIAGIGKVMIKSNGIKILSKLSKIKINDLKDQVLLNVFKGKRLGNNDSDFIQVVKSSTSNKVENKKVKIEYLFMRPVTSQVNLDNWLRPKDPLNKDNTAEIYAQYIASLQNKQNTQYTNSHNNEMEKYIDDIGDRNSVYNCHIPGSVSVYSDNTSVEDEVQVPTVNRIVQKPQFQLNELTNQNNALVAQHNNTTQHINLVNSNNNNNTSNNVINNIPLTRRSSIVSSMISYGDLCENIEEQVTILKDNLEDLIKQKKTIYVDNQGIQHTEAVILKQFELLQKQENKLIEYQAIKGELDVLRAPIAKLTEKLNNTVKNCGIDNLNEYDINLGKSLKSEVSNLINTIENSLFTCNDLSKMLSENASNQKIFKIISDFNEKFVNYSKDFNNKIISTKAAISELRLDIKRYKEHLRLKKATELEIDKKIFYLNQEILDKQEYLNVAKIYKKSANQNNNNNNCIKSAFV